jgi:hypothetical protein
MPVVGNYPAAYVNLCVALLRKYFSSAEAAKAGPDGALMEEVMSVLGPYLKDEGE